MFGCDRMLSLWSHCGNPCKSAASEHDPCRTCLWQETTCALLITSESKTQLSTVPVLQSPSSVNNKYWLVLSHMRLSPALISYRDKTIKNDIRWKKTNIRHVPRGSGRMRSHITLSSELWEQSDHNQRGNGLLAVTSHFGWNKALKGEDTPILKDLKELKCPSHRSVSMYHPKFLIFHLLYLTFNLVSK